MEYRQKIKIINLIIRKFNNGQSGDFMSKIYSIWFHEIGLPEVIKKELVTCFQSFESIYKASQEEYMCKGWQGEIVQRIKKSPLFTDVLEERIKRYESNQVKLVDYLDEGYPEYLRYIPDSPMLLYIKGNDQLLNSPTIGIVGSRNCSEYGYSVTVQLAQELAGGGITVISGMAMGVDAAAHYGALKSGMTIAVLGNGLNICYPACNQRIYEEILSKGCIISEYDLDHEPRPYQFPKRNRIISGMSMCVVVTEANIRSGSLITAQLALDYGRDVCAIPGNITRKLSLGTNELIKKGAKCVTGVEDVIEELPFDLRIKYEEIKKNKTKKHYELAQEERIVYAYVSQEPIFLNELVNSTQLSYKSIYKGLLQLEIKGLIKRLPGERYVRV